MLQSLVLTYGLLPHNREDTSTWRGQKYLDTCPSVYQRVSLSHPACPSLLRLSWKKKKSASKWPVSRVHFRCVIFTCAVFFPLNEGEMTAKGKHMYMIPSIGMWTTCIGNTPVMTSPRRRFSKNTRTCHLPHGCVSCACRGAKCDASDHHDNPKYLSATEKWTRYPTLETNLTCDQQKKKYLKRSEVQGTLSYIV